MKRLDEMDFNEITIAYKDIFYNLIGDEEFKNVKEQIENLYNEYIENVTTKGYKVLGGTLGRGELKWGRNIIWGWYIELLIKEVLSRNEDIKEILFLGGDSSHTFICDNEKKKLNIIGQKSVSPDFLIILKDNTTFSIELKTAAVEVFSIKKGNIEQLYKETAYNNRINLILMVDLENKLFSIENLMYFNLLKPFVNNRMEGQLCYNFPAPENEIGKLKEINFRNYLDNNIFEIDFVRKLKALKKAEDQNNENLIRTIKNKIKVEKLKENLDFQTNEIHEQILKIENKYPGIKISWEEIFKQLGIEKNN